MAESTAFYPPGKPFRGQDGAWYFNGGSIYNSNAVDVRPMLDVAVYSTAAKVKITRSTGVLSTSNPTSVVTGLASVFWFGVQLNSTATPTTAEPVNFRWKESSTAGEVHLYAWKSASTASSELVANTSSAAYSWLAVGTT